MSETSDDELREKVAVARSRIAGNTMHAMWDVVLDAEAHLENRRAICDKETTIQMFTEFFRPEQMIERNDPDSVESAAADRPEGYYWVRSREDEWEVAQWMSGAWWACGSEESFDVVYEVGSHLDRHLPQ